MSAVRRRTVVCLGVVAVTLMTVAGGSGGPGPVEAVTHSQVSAVQVAAEAPVATSRVSAAPAAPDGPPLPVVMAASRPLAVEIPAIDVDSELMELGLRDDGTMEVPPGAFPAGWFSGAPTPGELGPAVIAGHIDWVTGPGVFARLGSMAVGDEIRVRRADGTVAVFRTVQVARFPKDQFPTDLVYGNIDHAGLRVISCGGDFDDRTGHYEDNIVVFADLVA